MILHLETSKRKLFWIRNSFQNEVKYTFHKSDKTFLLIIKDAVTYKKLNDHKIWSQHVLLIFLRYQLGHFPIKSLCHQNPVRKKQRKSQFCGKIYYVKEGWMKWNKLHLLDIVLVPNAWQHFLSVFISENEVC